MNVVRIFSMRSGCTYGRLPAGASEVTYEYEVNPSQQQQSFLAQTMEPDDIAAGRGPRHDRGTLFVDDETGFDF